MDWYRVTKTIRGLKYDYWQKTYRVGRSVKTLNKYIGPHTGFRSVPQIPTGAMTLPLPFASAPLPIKQFNDKAFKLLIETPTKDANWRHHWTKQAQPEKRVKLIPAIEIMLKQHVVKRTQQSTGCYYAPSEDRINIPKADRFIDTERQTATQAYYVVVFHELIHWTGHRTRTPRAQFHNYPLEELVAELGAITIMEHFGLDIGDHARHALYFQTWLNRIPQINRDEALEYARKEATRAAQFIIKGSTI
jgi:hypothetical protein